MKTSLPSLSDTQRSALISLLTDEDPAIYQTVRSRILAYGDAAGVWLRPYLLSSDPALRRRAQEIVDHLARQNTDNQFVAFCLRHGEDFELEAGLWMLVKTQYPGINSAAYSALLDSFAADLKERVSLQGPLEQILAGINEFVFDHLGFKPNDQHYYDPDNSYLNRVIDRRTGNPISLCLIYILLGRRLRLPITGIGLPGHFVCRYQSATNEIYVDAFNRGKLLSKADCIRYLLQTNHGLQEGHLAPVTNRRILLRICANLHQIYAKLEWAEETARLQRYLVALAK